MKKSTRLMCKDGLTTYCQLCSLLPLVTSARPVWTLASRAGCVDRGDSTSMRAQSLPGGTAPQPSAEYLLKCNETILHNTLFVTLNFGSMLVKLTTTFIESFAKYYLWVCLFISEVKVHDKWVLCANVIKIQFLFQPLLQLSFYTWADWDEAQGRTRVRGAEQERHLKSRSENNKWVLRISRSGIRDYTLHKDFGP